MSDDPTTTPRPETSLDARPEPRAGIAPIKPAYLLDSKPAVQGASSGALNSAAPYSTIDDDAEGTTGQDRRGSRDSRDARDARDSKRRKTDKKERKGQNKGRSFPVIREMSVKLCRAWETTGECSRGEQCRYNHSWDGYFELKPTDIHFDPNGQLLDHGDYVVGIMDRRLGGEDEIGKKVDMTTTCPVYKDLGYCPYGWRCRFLGGHLRKIEQSESEVDGGGGPSRIGQWEVTGHKAPEKGQWRVKETNWPEGDVLARLRTQSYPFPFSAKYLHHIEPQKYFNLGRNERKSGKPDQGGKRQLNGDVKEVETPNNEEEAMNKEESAMNVHGENGGENGTTGHVDGESESLDVPLRPEEKRRLDWENGLYLAPLTTVGNLPFRRLCVSYGATITCCEMALAQPLVTGHGDEWALVRRHESEKMAGVQVAGGFPNRMVPVAEMLAKEVGNGIDFVDVNLGCPIDLVFNQGAGSALMDAPGRLGKILVGMSRALGEVPLTVKFRTGVGRNQPNAHKLIPRFVKEWGARAMTLHGRSRQQRYGKLADWSYIRQCADTLRETLSDAGLPPVPIFGNGDCFSAQSYYEEKEASGVDGVMVARGALIKPWIFTEIAERREWDISAVERLEGIRKYAEFGLSHWGSDTQGVSTTRRFLCEALSFQHRYIPIGLLERMPPKLNERPPAFRGRSELETLFSSPYAGDWVKISEMFLGKAEEEFKFVPKHKSNAYGGEEAQG